MTGRKRHAWPQASRSALRGERKPITSTMALIRREQFHTSRQSQRFTAFFPLLTVQIAQKQESQRRSPSERSDDRQ